MASPEQNNAAMIVRRNSSSSLFEGAMLLLVGFVFFNHPDFSDNQTAVDHAIDILISTLRIGGCLTVVTACLCWTGRPLALLLDSLVSVLTGLGLLIPALLVLIDGSLVALLVVLFGAMSLRNAWSTWSNYHLAMSVSAGRYPSDIGGLPESDAVTDPVPDPEAKAEAMERLLSTKQARPAVPAKVDLRPKDEPPPDGFLAELGREHEPKQD